MICYVEFRFFLFIILNVQDSVVFVAGVGSIGFTVTKVKLTPAPRGFELDLQGPEFPLGGQREGLVL